MWDYVPTRFYSAGDVDARRASDLLTDGYDRVDPSPRDHQSTTCAITHLSDVDRKALRTPRGIPRSGGSSSNQSLEMHLTAAIIRKHDRRITIGRCGNDEEEPRDRAAIAARSSRDRGAIEPRSHTLCRGIDPLELTLIDGALGVRSTPDQSPIGRKSWSIVAEIVAFLEADLKPKSRGFIAELKPRCYAQRSAPTSPSTDTHDRFQWPRFRA